MQFRLRDKSFPSNPPADRVLKWKALKTSDPDQGHPIGHNHVSRIQDQTETVILPGFRNAVHRRYRHVTRGSPRTVDPRTQPVDCIRHLSRVYTNSEDLITRKHAPDSELFRLLSLGLSVDSSRHCQQRFFQFDP